MKTLRFDGSLYLSIEIALRRLDQVYARVLEDLEMTIIEWYVLRSLLEENGQHPSQLARKVGRAPTAFTPILDSLEEKELVERRPDRNDRRAILIHLTDKGKALRRRIRASAEQVEQLERRAASDADWPGFQRILARLVALNDARHG